MHIKLLYRKVLYVFLSVMIVIAPTLQSNAASSWNIDSVKSSGSRVVLGASNSGYKSAINIPPNLAKIAKFGMKGANAIGLIQIAASLLNDGVDFVLDPENNTVKYKQPAPAGSFMWSHSKTSINKYIYPSADDAAAAACGQYFRVDYREPLPPTVACLSIKGDFVNRYSLGRTSVSFYENSLSISDLAPSIVSDAQSSDAQKRTIAQKILQDVAKAAVVAGDYDADLLAGAVPISGNETKPLVPSVPIGQAGDVDTGLTGGDVGAAADAARAAADAARAAADAAKNYYDDAVKDAAKSAADAKDLINQSIDQAIKDAAAAAAADAARAAADAKSVADAAAQAAADAVSAAAKAQSAAAVQAAADAKSLADALRASGNASSEAIAAADAAVVAANEAVVAAKEAVKDAKEASKELAKPFELPAFCAWASVVCEYTVWVKEEYGKMARWLKEEPTSTPAELMPIDDDSAGLGGIFQDKAEAGYVSFESSCPADVLIPVDLMGASQTLTISYTPFCHFASLIRYAVILGAWISGLLIVTGGRSRE